MPTSTIDVHAFLKCSRIWRQIDSARQEQMLDFASVLWTTPEGKVSESVPNELLEELKSQGLLVLEGDRYRFAPPQMLFFLRAVDLIDSLALASRPVDEVLQELADVISSAVPDLLDSFKRREVAGYVLAQLVNEYGRQDILEFAVSEEMPERRFWALYEPICNSLPALELDVESYAKILRAMADRTRGDLAAGGEYSAAECLGRIRPGFASMLADHMADSEGENRVGLLRSLLTGIARSSPDGLDATAAKCELWLDSDEERLCQAALACAENLIPDDKLDMEWLLSRVDAVVRKSDGVRYTLAVVITALGAKLHDYSDECLRILEQLKGRGPADRISHGIASALSHARDGVSIDYSISCLSMLEDVPVTDKGTIEWIGWVLYPIAHAVPRAVWCYLERWIQARRREQSVADHNMFLSRIRDAYRQQPDLGTQVLTRWFASSDLRLVEEARSILVELKIQGFDAAEVKAMSAQIIEYVTEKVLAGRFDGPHLIRLFYSILMNTIHIDELASYFLRVLRYLTWNYPGSTEEFLDQVIDEEDTATASVLLRKARRELEQYQAQRREVFVPELSPSKRRVQRYQEFEAKKMRALQEATFEDDRFPLQKLLSRVAIGRGVRTFRMNDTHPDPAQRRTFSDPTGFGEFSASIEIPRGEIVDPEGETWRRIVRLKLTLEDVE